MTDRDLMRAAHRRFVNEQLTPAELAAEIDRWEQHRALLAGDLNHHDFTDLDEATIRAGIAYADVRLTELDRQAERMLRAGRTGPGNDLSLTFARAKYVDLVALAETLTAQRAHTRGNRHVIRCPFHDDDDTPSLTIYPPGGGWACFGCGKAGQDAASFCAEFFGCSQLDGLRWVEQLCDGVMP